MQVNIGKFNPQNYEEEKNNFFAKHGQYNPQFTYAIPPVIQVKYAKPDSEFIDIAKRILNKMLDMYGS